MSSKKKRKSKNTNKNNKKTNINKSYNNQNVEKKKSNNTTQTKNQNLENPTVTSNEKDNITNFKQNKNMEESKEVKIENVNQAEKNTELNKKNNENTNKPDKIILPEKKDKKSDDNKHIESFKKSDTNKEKNENIVKSETTQSKNKTILAIIILLFVIVILVFSTIFAFINVNKNTFANGVSINDIDISNLTIEQAKDNLENIIKKELMVNIDLTLNNQIQFEFDPTQIEYSYDLDKTLLEAYNIGRKGNIFENNYEIVFASFKGKNIESTPLYNETLLNNIIDNISTSIPGIVVQASYYIEDNELIINNGTDGISVNKDKLKKAILDNLRNRTPENLKKEQIEIPIEKTPADPINIDKIYSEIYTEPKDAYFEKDPFKIYAEVNGIDLELPLDEIKEIINSENKDEYKFKLKITKPKKTINDIGTEAFPYLISSYSTKYDASNVNRSKNLAIAAGKINGTVLMPGDTFSFNKVVGKRTVEEGYRDAKIYQNGSVVDGLAGGICQISSTLYNAVLLANLEVVERSNHSFTTSYIPAGRDATVVYGVKDFQFKNSRSYPIKIEAKVSNGIAEFKMHGIAEENEYEVKIMPVTTQSIPYTTEHIPDPSLPTGQQIVSQSGHAGYKVTTYKELRLNGNFVSKEIISNDTYQPMKTIVRVGP